MSAAPTRVTLWSDFQSAGGTYRGVLEVERGLTRTRVDGDDRCYLTVTRTSWKEKGGDTGMVVCVEWPETAHGAPPEEWAIENADEDDESATVAIEALPPSAVLGQGGVIRRTVAGRVTSKIVGAFSRLTWITDYVCAHPSAVRLNVLVGTIEDPEDVVDVDMENATPWALLRRVAQDREPVLERVNASQWRLHLFRARADQLAPFIVRPGVHIRSRWMRRDASQLATVIEAFGDPDATGARATIAQMKARVTASDGGSPGWVGLEDGVSGRPFIVTDGQWENAYVVKPGNVRTKILASRASDSSVQLQNASGLTPGLRVGFVATSDGQPLLEVYDQPALTARGRRVKTLVVPGARGEAQELADGRFQQGSTTPTYWTARNPTTPAAVVPMTRDQLGVTRSGTILAGRAAGVGTGTPYQVGGLTANEWLRRLDRLVIAGQTVTSTGPAVANADGTITLPCAALANSIPAGTSVQFRRKGPTGTPRTLAVGTYRGAAAQVFGYNNVAGNLCVCYFDVGVGGTYLDVPYHRTGIADARSGGVDPRDANFMSDRVLLAGTFETRDTIGAAYYYATFAFVPVWLPIQLFPSTMVYGQPYGQQLHGLSWPGNQVSLTGQFLALAAVLPAGQLLYSVAITPQTVNVETQRETRTTTVAVTAGVGATSVQLAAYSGAAIARPTAFQELVFSKGIAATLAITSAPTTPTSTIAVTVNTGTSTIAALTPAERLTLRFAVMATRYHASTPGIPISTELTWFRVTAVSGSTVTLESDEWDAEESTYWHAVISTPQTVSASGRFSRSFMIGTDAPAWTPGTDYATAAWPIVVSSGHPGIGETWAAGTLVWVTKPAGGLSALDRAEAAHATPFALDAAWTVVEGTTSRTVRGYDAGRVLVPYQHPTYPPWVPSESSIDEGPYLAGTGSEVVVAGEIVTVANSVQANGSGQANVTPTTANTNAVGAGAAWSLSRPALLRGTDPTTGWVVRLAHAVGGGNVPTSATPGAESELQTLYIAPGAPRAVRAFVTVAMNAGVYAVGQQPAIALIDSSNTVLATGKIADSTVIVNTLAHVQLTCVATLTATTALRIAVYGGFSDQPTTWHVPLDAMLVLTDAEDVPYTDDAHANALALQAIDVQAARRLPVVALRVTWARMRRWTDAPNAVIAPVVGQRVQVPDLALERRVTAIERAIESPEQRVFELGLPSTALSRRVAQLLTNAALG